MFKFEFYFNKIKPINHTKLQILLSLGKNNAMQLPQSNTEKWWCIKLGVHFHILSSTVTCIFLHNLIHSCSEVIPSPPRSFLYLTVD